MPIDDCKIIKIPTAADFFPGRLSFIEGRDQIPFDIKRVYYLFDVQSGDVCAGNADKTTTSLVIAVRGSFDVLLDDGHEKRTHFLNLPYQGLLIPPMMWKQFSNFSSGSVCMVLASTTASECDEIARYDEFLRA
jgi:hypothetical protein